MLITDGNISQAASYRYVEQHTESARLTLWVGEHPGSRPAAQSPATAAQPPADSLDLSPASQAKLAAEDDPLDEKTRLAKLIVELLTGHKIKLLRLSDLKRESAAEAQPGEGGEAQGEPAQAPAAQGWGVEYHTESTYAERQELSYAAEGVVRTKDGQEIRFSLQLQASREFVAQESFDFRAGDAVRKVDPLVINFDGLVTDLSPATFQFDLNTDGQAEDIHFVGAGSGFLTLDRNGDGKVTDGSELFGPSTGNGLAELSALDADGNGWLDEGDPAYSRLRVWTRDGGGDHLTPLAEAGVGALYLRGVAAEFAHKDAANELTGATRQMGFYLRPDGQARSLQQIDLVV